MMKQGVIMQRRNNNEQKKILKFKKPNKTGLATWTFFFGNFPTDGRDLHNDCRLLSEYF